MKEIKFGLKIEIEKLNEKLNKNPKHYSKIVYFIQ